MPRKMSGIAIKTIDASSVARRTPRGTFESAIHLYPSSLLSAIPWAIYRKTEQFTCRNACRMARHDTLERPGERRERPSHRARPVAAAAARGQRAADVAPRGPEQARPGGAADGERPRGRRTDAAA